MGGTVRNEITPEWPHHHWNFKRRQRTTARQVRVHILISLANQYACVLVTWGKLPRAVQKNGFSRDHELISPDLNREGEAGYSCVLDGLFLPRYVMFPNAMAINR